VCVWGWRGGGCFTCVSGAKNSALSPRFIIVIFAAAQRDGKIKFCVVAAPYLQRRRGDNATAREPQ
jgi:hypothetical protein